MNADYADNAERQIEAYLDGRLNVAEREAFERRLDREGELRAAVDVQRVIDRSLRGVFAAPAMDQILARVQSAARAETIRFPRQTVRMPLLVKIAAAAVIGIAVGVGYVVWDTKYNPANQPKILAKQTMIEFYRERENSGWKPDWVCEPERFRFTFGYRLNQPLQLASGNGVVMMGLAYSNTISPATVNVMTQVNGRNVMVFADRAEAGDEHHVCEGSGLHVFKRKLGALNLYEVTPLNEPHVLDLLYIPGDPATAPAS